MAKPIGLGAVPILLNDFYQRGLAGFVLLGAAIADQQLQDAILSKMRKLTRKETDELFTGFGPLGSLSAKTAMAYALGLMDARTRDRLHGIRRIRNRFAHAEELMNFKHPDIKALMAKLPQDAPSEKREEHVYMWHLGEVETHLVATAGPQIRRSGA